VRFMVDVVKFITKICSQHVILFIYERARSFFVFVFLEITTDSVTLYIVQMRIIVWIRWLGSNDSYFIFKYELLLAEPTQQLDVKQNAILYRKSYVSFFKIKKREKKLQSNHIYSMRKNRKLSTLSCS
jgi:hypothetical protein